MDEVEGAEPALDAGPPEVVASISRVQGQVWLEVPPPEPEPEPEPVVEVTIDPSGDVQAEVVQSDGESEGETDPELDAPPPEPPPVELVPPPAGRCTVIAWQQGEQVSEPTSCAPDGSFEVTLAPDRHGRTAFEVLVPGHLRAVLEVDVPPGGQGRLPAVALGEAVRVDGHVVDGRGEPIAGIVVEAMPHPNLEEPEPWRAVSDDSGAFAFETLPAGPVSLKAAASGYATSVVEALAPQSDLLVTLEGLVDLKGRVAGAPEALARARIRIEGSGIWPVREEAVDPDGHFVLPGIPDGIYALEAVVEAVAQGEPEFASIPLENVTPELSITLALVPAFRVPVEVRAPDGTPVPGARVTLSNASIGLLPRLALADDEGHVAMGPVVPGPYVLRAHADGFLPSPPVAVTIEGPDGPLQVLTLAEPGRLAGRVVDHDGYPVANARVDLMAEHLFTAGEGQTRARFAQAALQSAGSLGVTTGPVPKVPVDDDTRADMGTSKLTDEDGRFAFEMLVPGHYRLEAHHRGYAQSDELRVRLGAAGTRGGLRLVLRNGHRLTGRVRDGNDRPVRGASVVVGNGRSVSTDRRGVFDAGIHRGRRRLVVRAAGLAPSITNVTIEDGPVDVEVVLGRARAELRGKVVGGNGEVLADARVTLRTVDGLSATRIVWTDDKGLYRFEDLPSGSVEIEVDHPEHGPVTRTVEFEDEDSREQVDVELARGWSIDVDVLIEGSGEALSGVRVEAGGVHARTDSDGRVTLRRLSDERVTVEVRADGFGSRRVKVERDGAERRSVRVELAVGGGLRGRVIDYRGDAVPRVQIVVRDEDEEIVGRTRTDGKGRWELFGIPVGDVEVSADPPLEREDELASASRASDVIRGHVTRDVDLRFDRR